MNSERLYKVLLGPVVTEKATLKADQDNQAVFKVVKDATTAEISAAVEKLFKVDVANVTTLNVKGKVKRNRYGFAKKADWKKAYVRLAPGQEIDFTSFDAV